MYITLTDFPNYSVDEQGNVKNNKTNYILKWQYLPSGYAYIKVKHPITRKQTILLIHRLVAEAFIPNPHHLPEINHKDENKLNNTVENLEWCTRQYNLSYGTRLNRIKENTERIKPVECIETGEVFSSGHEVEIKLGIKNVVRACRGERKSAGGYHWRFRCSTPKTNT